MSSVIRLLGRAWIAAIIVTLVSFCSGCTAGTTRPAPPRLSHVRIVRGPQGQNDLDLKSYEEVFDSVSLQWELLTGRDLETIGSIDPGLVLVIPAAAARSLTGRQLRAAIRAVEAGALLVTEEINPLSLAMGFNKGPAIVTSETEELAYPDIAIKWRSPAEVVTLQLPKDALPLNRERGGGHPLSALLPRGRGKCLLLATELDAEDGRGFVRYPYFLHELVKAGVVLPFRSECLGALFDYAYHVKDDPPALARGWYRTGISSVHVGAWDFFDLKAGRNDYLKRLIEACHQNGILVYAWLEWPHVSEHFWDQHPGWREKAATGRDAPVDWRALVNLEDPDCFRAATAGLRRLLLGFDWDGVDIAELYFESTSGPADPESFTPMNKRVRKDYLNLSGIDPAEFFKPDSDCFWRRNKSAWSKFVDYRANLERNLNERVLQSLSDLRRTARPWFDLILLYVDNIYDPSMREAVGADLTLILPLLDKYDFTLVMEDPSTVWHLGPRRYEELAAGYTRLTSKTDRLGIDINIVDRDQKVAPTRKQTGSEFLQLFHYAGRNFRTVMAYSEATMHPQDRDLVSYALASGASVKVLGGRAQIRSNRPVVFNTGNNDEILVDGRLWPCVRGKSVLVPAGTHEISLRSGSDKDRPRLIRLNGSLRDAFYSGPRGIGFSYDSKARAIAVFDRPARSFQIDAGSIQPGRSNRLMLPAGSHQVQAEF
jgi:hypothetical protein